MYYVKFVMPNKFIKLVTLQNFQNAITFNIKLTIKTVTTQVRTKYLFKW